MATKTDTRKKAMLQALTKTLGIVSPACDLASLTRDTHYKWMKEDPEYAKAVSEIGDVDLDFAEHRLRKAIEKGNVTAIIFYLKTKGRKRGYIEHRAVEESTPLENQTTAEVILPDGTKITL